MADRAPSTEKGPAEDSPGESSSDHAASASALPPLSLAEPPRKRSLWRWVALATVGLLLAAVGVSFSSHAIRWRARLALARLGGQYHEIPPAYFFRCLRPSSAVDLSPLLESPNVRAAIRNPFTDEHAANEGMRVFNDNCAKCHGEKGAGGAGPSLLTALAKTGDWGYFSTVKWGRPNTLMLPQPLADREIWATETYVRRLLRASEISRARQTGQLSVDVPAEAIVGSSESSDGWLTYAGVLAGHRHSRLRQIDKSNVHRLAMAWTAQFRTTEDSLQGSALVAGNILFVPGPPGEIDALDARTGNHLWQFQRPHATGLALCCGTGNRGVAILGDHLFAATLDAHLLALDAASGHLSWEVEVADHSEGYSMTSAPLVVGDRVIVGIAGGDYGPRGFLAAFSAKDGHRLWQFDTVPGPGQPGHETWAGDSWQTGGAATWVTGAADPGLGLVYWGVGNAAPVYNAALRQGDNLYSMSVIALDIETGKLRWYYQFTPHDEHDWDSANQPIVADIDWQGTRVPALLWANRNGFFYALDRRNGKFLYAKPFVKQTWAKGFQPDGRPILDPGGRPTAGGTVVWPWVGGATNWQPPSYDAGRGLVFIPAIDTASLYYASPAESRESGQIFRAGAADPLEDQPVSLGVKAVAVATGETRWQAELGSGLDVRPTIGGVLSTDSGLVFLGQDQSFLVLDADTGQELWRRNLGGGIRAGAIAYAVDGQEMIAVMAGRSLFAFSVPLPLDGH